MEFHGKHQDTNFHGNFCINIFHGGLGHFLWNSMEKFHAIPQKLLHRLFHGSPGSFMEQTYSISLNVVPNSNPLGIKRFVSGISISFKCECHIIMQIQHTKNLNHGRLELGTTLSQPNRSIHRNQTFKISSESNGIHNRFWSTAIYLINKKTT